VLNASHWRLRSLWVETKRDIPSKNNVIINLLAYFILWNRKEDILKNVRNQTTLEPIDISLKTTKTVRHFLNFHRTG